MVRLFCLNELGIVVWLRTLYTTNSKQIMFNKFMSDGNIATLYTDNIELRIATVSATDGSAIKEVKVTNWGSGLAYAG